MAKIFYTLGVILSARSLTKWCLDLIKNPPLRPDEFSPPPGARHAFSPLNAFITPNNKWYVAAAGPVGGGVTSGPDSGLVGVGCIRDGSGGAGVVPLGASATVGSGSGVWRVGEGSAGGRVA